MTLRESPALLQALALLDNPRGPRPEPGEPLPADVLCLVRIAAGDQERLAAAVRATGLAGETLREAVVFYIQQVLFAPTSDCYRVLGVGPQDPEELLREHHRWLLRWLHPDRNADQWEVVYAERVTRAWQELRTAERRQRYDSEAAAAVLRGKTALQSSARADNPRAPLALFVEPVSDLRAKAPGLRWLPSLVFGTLGISAVLAVGLLYAMRSFDALQAPAVVADVKLAPTAELSEVTISWPRAPPPAPTPRAVTASPGAAPPPATAPPPESMASAEPVAASPRMRQELRPPPAVQLPALHPTLPIRPEASPLVVPNVVRRASTLPDSPPVAAVSLPAQSSAQQTAPAPVVAASPVPPRSAAKPPVARPQIDDRVAYALLNEFSDIYRRGDLARLQDLLTDDARSAGGGRDSLLSEYNQLFASSARRRLTVSNVSWLDNGQTASIIASFEASVVPRNGGRPRRSRGDLRLDLRLDEGEWRIYRLAHDEHRG